MARKKRVDESPDIELGSIDNAKAPSFAAQEHAAKMASGKNSLAEWSKIILPETNGKGQPVPELAGFQITSNGHVTQTALREYLGLKRRIADAKAKAEEAAKPFAAEIEQCGSKLILLEAEFIKAWNDGKRSEPGPDKAQLIVETSERSTPKWKEEAIILAVAQGRDGKDYEAEISKKYKVPKTTVKVI